MYGNELFKKGVYGIMDTSINKMVYIGSTNASFVTRWGYHSNDIRFKTHCNKALVELFKGGNFEFVILEAGEFTSRQLLEKEKYFTGIYKVVEEGYCIHVGGGSLMNAPRLYNADYGVDDNIKIVRDYICEKWLDKKMYQENKEEVAEYLRSHGIESGKFMVTLRKLGFIVQRFSDKRSCLITGKTY